jgi:hypothetical protein
VLLDVLHGTLHADVHDKALPKDASVRMVQSSGLPDRTLEGTHSRMVRTPCLQQSGIDTFLISHATVYARRPRQRRYGTCSRAFGFATLAPSTTTPPKGSSKFLTIVRIGSLGFAPAQGSSKSFHGVGAAPFAPGHGRDTAAELERNLRRRPWLPGYFDEVALFVACFVLFLGCTWAFGAFTRSHTVRAVDEPWTHSEALSEPRFDHD